jgi:hypothetical protein
VRSLTEAGQTSSQWSCSGPAGNVIARPSGSQPGFNTRNVETGAEVGAGLGLIGIGEYGPIGILPGAIIGAAIGAIISFFEDIFGGSDNPPIPRQLRHGRHPLYDQILGVQPGLIVGEGSAVLELETSEAGISEPSSGIAEPSAVSQSSVRSGIILVADQRYGLPDLFWSWYHRQVTKPGDPDLTKEEAEQWYKIWVQEGKPDAEGHRTTNMVPVVPLPCTPDVPLFPIPAPGEGGVFIFGL